jgi:signal peptidase I
VKVQGTSGTAEKPAEQPWLETVKVVVHALILAGLVRMFLFQPFNIPSGSMKSTLLVGDYLFVSKLSYGYSRYSFVFGLPVFQGRVFGSEPKRGDVAVFKLPRDNSTDYIKRVIGLPGDTISVRGGIVSINGTEVPRRKIGTYVDQEEDGSGRTVEVYEETLPNGVKFKVLDAFPDGPADNFPRVGGATYTVPAGHYFMMGDNRDNSTDSRDLRNVGPVPYQNFIGRADLIFYSVDPTCSYAPESAWIIQKLRVVACASGFGIRFSRLFNLVR